MLTFFYLTLIIPAIFEMCILVDTERYESNIKRLLELLRSDVKPEDCQPEDKKIMAWGIVWLLPINLIYMLQTFLGLATSDWKWFLALLVISVVMSMLPRNIFFKRLDALVCLSVLLYLIISFFN